MVVRPGEGFIHRGQIVYAVLYELEATPPSWLIVWLDRQGNSTKPWNRPADANKRMVTVRPGDFILHHDERRKVVDVSIYRALPLNPGYEIAK